MTKWQDINRLPCMCHFCKICQDSKVFLLCFPAYMEVAIEIERKRKHPLQVSK